MEHGIERKFLVNDLPRLRGNIPVLFEKYFIQVGDVIEEAVQKRNGTFEYEKKVCLSRHECKIERSPIAEKEFEKLKISAMQPLVYEKYAYDVNPLICISIFKGNHEGLSRAEVTFDSLEEAEDFEVLPWMGKDITQSALGMDKSLATLTNEQCIKLIQQEIASTQA